METARRAKSVTLGAAPLVGYLLAKETITGDEFMEILNREG